MNAFTTSYATLAASAAGCAGPVTLKYGTAELDALSAMPGILLDTAANVAPTVPLSPMTKAPRLVP